MTRPVRELNDVQHHVLEVAAENYARAWEPGERMRLATQRAAQAKRTTLSNAAFYYAVEAAALLILEAESINRRHLSLGMAQLVPELGL